MFLRAPVRSRSPSGPCRAFSAQQHAYQKAPLGDQWKRRHFPAASVCNITPVLTSSPSTLHTQTHRRSWSSKAYNKNNRYLFHLLSGRDLQRPTSAAPVGSQNLSQRSFGTFSRPPPPSDETDKFSPSEENGAFHDVDVLEDNFLTDDDDGVELLRFGQRLPSVPPGAPPGAGPAAYQDCQPLTDDRLPLEAWREVLKHWHDFQHVFQIEPRHRAVRFATSGCSGAAGGQDEDEESDAPSSSRSSSSSGNCSHRSDGRDSDSSWSRWHQGGEFEGADYSVEALGRAALATDWSGAGARVKYHSALIAGRTGAHRQISRRRVAKLGGRRLCRGRRPPTRRGARTNQVPVLRRRPFSRILRRQRAFTTSTVGGQFGRSFSSTVGRQFGKETSRSRTKERDALWRRKRTLCGSAGERKPGGR